MDNGLPFCVSEGTLQCPCLENYSGAFCNECAEGYFGFPECERKNPLKQSFSCFTWFFRFNGFGPKVNIQILAYNVHTNTRADGIFFIDVEQKFQEVCQIGFFDATALRYQNGE